ncbi:MAG: S9 family peptidase [Crocinitomicaceae bacterium]|nr:S9 family peptidase [Crocinitomicaceae bacterium]
MKVFSILSVFLITLSIKAQNVLTPELLWKFNRVSGGVVSPDGNFLLYSQRSFNMSENKGNTELFVIDLKTTKTKQITQTPFSEMEAQWGKNNTIWFMSTENEGLQIWTMSADGSAKKQVSRFAEIELEGFKLSPDEKSLVTIQAVKTKQTLQDKYADLPKANARVEEDLMYRHWDHYTDFMSRHLFIHEITTNANGFAVMPIGVDVLKNELFDGILPPFGGTEQFCYTPDAKKLIYTSKKLKGKEFAQSTNSELYEYSIDTKKTRTLTEGYLGYDNNPSYSSTGVLAWTSMARNGFEADKNDIIIRGLDGKDINLTAQVDQTVGSFVWHPSGNFIYFISPTKGTEQIFEIDLKTKKIRQVTSGQHDYVSLSIFGNSIYAGRQSMVAPTDLFMVPIKKGTITQLTAANAELLSTITLPKVEEKWITTTDGKQMLVWMVLPPNFDQDKQYPSLLYCQGGPQSMVSQFFSYRWNLALMASQGYVVVAPNRRGLPGFGQEWNDAISTDWGGQAMKDYLSAADEAFKLPYIDRNRMGAVGASYGGYSVYMLAGIHENRFKTFISHCGLFNLESWFGTTEELFFANWDHKGPYWKAENKENYTKNSPHNYVQNWNTPILVIHGGMDFRVPESEGMQAFQAAQLLGLRSKYLHFPTEGHWVQSPQNGLLWQREFFEWLNTDLKP